MTPLVVDTSVAVAWFISQTYSQQALRILNQHQAGQWQFLAPDHLYAEFGNAIWRTNRANLLSAVDAQRIIHQFSRETFTLSSTALLLQDAYTLAVQHNRSVYDCLYIALAQQEKCTFVTADEKLFNAVNGKLPVTWLANWV